MSSYAPSPRPQPDMEAVSPFVQPSRGGYWACPHCSAVNKTVVFVNYDEDERKTYKVPPKVGCRSVFCEGVFDTIDPV